MHTASPFRADCQESRSQKVRSPSPPPNLAIRLLDLRALIRNSWSRRSRGRLASFTAWVVKNNTKVQRIIITASCTSITEARSDPGSGKTCDERNWE